MVYLTRREYFNGAHKLYKTDWSMEKNVEVFGKCANKNFHGHNFDVYVTVKGEPDPDTGFVLGTLAPRTRWHRMVSFHARSRALYWKSSKAY